MTINLAPADLRKEGSGFDLPMALGWRDVWASFSESHWISACFWANYRWMEVRAVRGSLSAAIHSVAGTLEDSRGLVGTRPYRSPQHTSDAGLIGTLAASCASNRHSSDNATRLDCRHSITWISYPIQIR